MKHTINITVLNNPLGTPQSSDGVMMIAIQAVAVSGHFELNTAYLLTSLNDLYTLLNVANATAAQALDVTNGTCIYQQVSEFYSEAGDGALLWLVGVGKTATTNQFAAAGNEYVKSTTFKNLIKFTGKADPANQVKMIGLCYAPPTATQIATDFYTDVPLALAAMQNTRTTLFSDGYCLNFIVDGTQMNNEFKNVNSLSGLTTLANDSYPNGSVCITGSTPNGVSSVGAALGRFAKISVGHALNNVSDGSISLQSAYLTNGCAALITSSGSLVVGETYIVSVASITSDSITYNVGDIFTATATSFTGSGEVNAYSTPVQSLYDNPDFQALGDKQFMFLRTWADHSGFYWNDAATACNSTLPLSTQEFGRVANKLTMAVRSFMIDTIGQNLPIDTKTGLVDQNYCNAKQQQFKDEIIVPLQPGSGTGDITDAKLVMVGTPSGNQITWSFTLTIVGTPIVGSIVGTIVFSYTL